MDTGGVGPGSPEILSLYLAGGTEENNRKCERTAAVRAWTRTVVDKVSDYTYIRYISLFMAQNTVQELELYLQLETTSFIY
jgi:hypothetical protein